MERIKDYLLMEQEFVQNQEQLKPSDERTEEDRSKVGCLRPKHSAKQQLCHKPTQPMQQRLRGCHCQRMQQQIAACSPSPSDPHFHPHPHPGPSCSSYPQHASHKFTSCSLLILAPPAAAATCTMHPTN
jgi:hypothetical protein